MNSNPYHRAEVYRRYAKRRFYHMLLLCALHAVVLYLVGWGWVVQSLLAPAVGNQTPPLPPGSELLILAPFFVGLLGSWLFNYDAERALHESLLEPDEPSLCWSRWEYLGYQVRHNLALVFIPLTLLIVEKGLLWCFPSAGSDWRSVASLIGLSGALAVFVCMPWLIRLVLGLTPLPDSPLRSRLLATAQRLNFRCNNVLLWDTRGNVANAMVVGILPWVRYVVLTDRLAAELTADEVEAVFGHEIGHVKHHHMVLYLGFLTVSLAVVWAVAAVYLRPYLDALPTLRSRDDLAILLLVACLGTYIFVVFGFLSRRCERQADIYGCRAVSCGRPNCDGHDPDTPLPVGGKVLCSTGIRTFVSALEKVGSLNGISRERPGWLQSWQHSTIARRVDFLHEMLRDAGAEPRFQWRVAVVKWMLLLLLAAVLIVLGSVHGWDKLMF